MKSANRIHPVYAQMQPTIFDRMSNLARKHGAINLGQGFPDGAGPACVVDAAARALREKSNQYPPSAGLLELREAICAFYAQRQGLSLDPSQVTITSGATEAIAAAILAFVQPGDEVILFQPAYDAYAPMVRRAGGVPVSVLLSPPHFTYDAEAFETAITPQTRVVLFNDPLNPAGTVASATELEALARICVAHDLMVISDEVWEDVRFDGVAHRSIMTYPSMADRVVKIGSAGKIFGLTGWKIGWMIAGAEAGSAVARVHQFLTFTSAVPLQWAIAEGLAMTDVLEQQRAEWAVSRARLVNGLESAGFVVLPNAATWFVCVDLKASGLNLTDRMFSERAVVEAGVATLPVSALYEAESAPDHIVRFCFTKSDEILDQAVERLAAWRQTL